MILPPRIAGMAHFYLREGPRKEDGWLGAEAPRHLSYWPVMMRVAACLLPAAFLVIFFLGSGLCTCTERFPESANLQPLLASGLENVATHLQVSAQVAQSLAQAIPSISRAGSSVGLTPDYDADQISTLLHLAFSTCQSWCAGMAVLPTHPDSRSHFVGNWPPSLQEQAASFVREKGLVGPRWQSVKEGDRATIFMVPVPSSKQQGQLSAAVAVAVDLDSLEWGLEKLDWRGGSFVVADGGGNVYAAAHAQFLGDVKKMADEVVACPSGSPSGASLCRLEGKDRLVVSEHRTVHGLRMRGVLVMPRAPLLPGAPPSSPYLSYVLRGLVVLSTVGGLWWFALSMKPEGVENALQAQIVGHLDDKKRAEAANSAKSMFLANVSHELRTPMAAILLGLDLVLEAGTLPSEQEASLLQVKHCASELLTLLNDILDLGKIESGKFQLEAVDFDLAHEIQSVVDMFGIQCAGKGIIIGLEVADEMERIVNGDPLRFRQILGNLISNSIKFTPPGGSIYVSARRGPKTDHPYPTPPPPTDSEEVPWWHRGRPWASKKESEDGGSDDGQGILNFEIEVNDTGCGLPPEKREAVFEAFTQADSSTTRMHGGTGLGLGITKKLVRMMGGTIGFVDKEGPGCLVRVQLSLAPPLVPITESPSHVLLHAPIPRLLRGARVILAMPPVLSRRLAEKWLQERGFDLHIFSSVEELMDGIHSGTLVPGFSCFPRLKPPPPGPETPTSPLARPDTSSPPTPGAQPEQPALPTDPPPLVIIDFAMVQAAAFTYPVGSSHTGPGNPTPQIVPPALGGGGSRLLTSPLVGGPSGASPVYDADETEQEPVLGPGEVISELARLKAEMGANIVWLLDPNTPPAVRSSLVKSRGFALLVLRPLHAGRLSEIMRKVGVVRERRRELDQARKNMEAQWGPGGDPAAGGAMDGQSVPPSPNASLAEESSVRSQPGEEVAKAVLPKGPKLIGLGTLRGFHILVVEDSAVLQKLVTSMLVKMGAKVAQASDGQQAVAIAEELRDSLDVILMDCQMPVLDGYSATRAIRVQERTSGRRVPIIALTAHAMLSDEQKCLEAGMDSYLSKPVSPTKLCDTIAKLVKPKVDTKTA